MDQLSTKKCWAEGGGGGGLLPSGGGSFFISTELRLGVKSSHAQTSSIGPKHHVNASGGDRGPLFPLPDGSGSFTGLNPVGPASVLPIPDRGSWLEAANLDLGSDREQAVVKAHDVRLEDESPMNRRDGCETPGPEAASAGSSDRALQVLRQPEQAAFRQRSLAAPFQLAQARVVLKPARPVYHLVFESQFTMCVHFGAVSDWTPSRATSHDAPRASCGGALLGTFLFGIKLNPALRG